MVLQYRKRKPNSVWKDYLGKKNLDESPEHYDFRLLTHDKSKILVEKGTYDSVLRRMRQIEFFKHKRGQSRIIGILDEIIE